MRKTFAWEIYRHPTPKHLAQTDLDELRQLIIAAGWSLAGEELYQLRDLSTHTFIGSGKLEKMREVFAAGKIDLIVVDAELKPYQIKNIEDIFNIEVVDRTRLILEIFKRRAHSREGKLQVELAEAQYELGRQLGSGGKGGELSKLGVGVRGPGEQIAEKRRRGYRLKIKVLKEKLAKVKRTRTSHQSQREESGRPLVTLVGYTNAGKSTLLNALTKTEEVKVRDELFTTVDPTTRKIFLETREDGHPAFAFVTDTVGFIRKLPHELVEGFESTLSMVGESDLVLIVIDASDPNWAGHLQIVQETLSRIGSHVQTEIVYNKIDQIERSARLTPSGMRISASTGEGIDRLKGILAERVALKS